MKLGSTYKTGTGFTENVHRFCLAIFKRAFDGKLVPQNPEDEPASVLLERVKEGKNV